MRPILKKRPREETVSCLSPNKLLAKSCNLRGGRHKQTRRPGDQKTHALGKAPPHPSDAPKWNDGPPGHLSSVPSQNSAETLAKYSWKQKKASQKAEEKKKNRVTFNLSVTDFGK